DDITVLMRAQKEAAWGEVAKRLAHEIRNPLTPIQLSAERLAWKLHDKLDEQDAQILSRSTDTIVTQVAALKEMVEAFRNYARAPSLNLEKQDLNGLVSEVLVLYEAGACKFNARLSADALPIVADTTAMRQV
ncbi:PAS domain-containing sensor histidine kinase, partial [Achromobacter xylosoxidans]|uniref:sensor histidine kinase n=1 Tax=Alcaligenes xylosoxydans xylosoxydans TaxID=85698 RepID=UPI0023EA57CB